MNNKVILYLFLCISLPFTIYSQAGTSFSEFTKKLEPYFELELINDINSSLKKLKIMEDWIHYNKIFMCSVCEQLTE